MVVPGQRAGFCRHGHRIPLQQAGAGYYTYDASGTLRGFRPSWLSTSEKGDELPASLIVRLSDNVTAEFLAYLPFVRLDRGTTVQLARADSCLAVPKNIRETFLDEDKRFGLPQPLGSGLGGKRPAASLFFIAAAPGPAGTAFAVGNGGVLFRIDADGALDCISLPLPETGPHYVLNGVQATNSHLAVMHIADGIQKLRIWRLDR